nr:hypothetical protein [Tanacetum cinerariifolium]
QELKSPPLNGMRKIGLLPIYLDQEERGSSCGSPARPSLFYFEDPSEEAFRTRKRWLRTRIGLLSGDMCRGPHILMYWLQKKP